MTTEREESLSREKSILRWGGPAGILAGLVFILVPVILFGFVPPAPHGNFRVEGGGQVDPAALVMMFPDVRAVMTAANLLNFMSDVFLLALFLSLYWALRGTRLTPALFGSALSILGVAVLFTESVIPVAFDPISNLYHAPGATPEQQAMAILLWQASQGIFYELDAAAVLLLTVGIFVLGVAMSRTSTFGMGLGGLSMVLGGVGFVLMSIFGITSFWIALVLIPTFVILPILIGWKMYGLSKAA